MWAKCLVLAQKNHALETKTEETNTKPARSFTT